MKTGSQTEAGGLKKKAAPPNWDRAADVVIVGYGGAGAAAAMAAHGAGVRVLIVESRPEGGGNTRVSMGGFLCPTEAKEAYTYLRALYDLSHSECDEEMLRVFTEQSVGLVEWVKSLREGTQVQVYGHAGFPELAGARSMNKYLVSGKGQGMTVFARNLWSLLSAAVETDRRIPILFDTPARRLMTDGQGRVIGLVADSKGRETAIRADRGVILATGGYEFDTKMLQNSVKGFPVYSLGSPGNRGDGVRMAQQAGAGLWHMNGVSCALGFKAPEYEAAFMVVVGAPGHIFVDRNGRRFVNERSIESHAGLLAVDFYDAHSLTYPRIPCYAVFDETARLAGPITRAAGLGAAGQVYEWSRDNSAEIEKGWIVRGDTLGDLAGKLDVSGDALEQTVAAWNEDVRQGRDSLFGRPVRAEENDSPAYRGLPAAVLSAPLDTPPFYALKLYPCLINTQGGPRRDAAARVLDAFGRPIPGLYSAGELGSMWGLIYQGAGNIAECMVFGRIAGQNAAAEAPWV